MAWEPMVAEVRKWLPPSGVETQMEHRNFLGDGNVLSCFGWSLGGAYSHQNVSSCIHKQCTLEDW